VPNDEEQKQDESKDVEDRPQYSEELEEEMPTPKTRPDSDEPRDAEISPPSEDVDIQADEEDALRNRRLQT
jgi:hypothetical protein